MIDPTNIKIGLDSTLGGSAPLFTNIKYRAAKTNTVVVDQFRYTCQKLIKIKNGIVIMDERWVRTPLYMWDIGTSKAVYWNRRIEFKKAKEVPLRDEIKENRPMH